LANHGISNPGNVQDWYEPYYLSVCKGRWQVAAAHLKNETSTVCMEMPAGYTFSLPELLAADAGLPADSPLFSAWSFAILHTEAPFVCLTMSFTFISWSMIDYFIGIVRIRRLTAESQPHWLRIGFIASILALITLILSSAVITATMHKILEAKLVAEKGVAWSTGGFYVLIWLATGLMGLVVILSAALSYKLRQQSRFLKIRAC
jgi:SUR7/PalI family